MDFLQASRGARFPADPVLVAALLAGALCVGVFLFTVGVLTGRERARSSDCQGRLYSLGVGLEEYRALHGAYPPVNGKGMGEAASVSWRVLLGAMLEDVKYRVDERSNSTWNSRVLAQIHRGMFFCPSDPRSEEAGITSYLAVVGPRTVWSEVLAGRITDPEREVPEKILLVEVSDSGISWTEPRDISVDEAIALFRAQKALKKHRHKEGLHFFTAGRRVHGFNDVGSVEEFASLLRVTE